jgi:very-short-patch-repair endonuclease
VSESYSKLSDEKKYKIIKDLYENNNKSFKDIADALGTYANKVRRDAIKFNIKIRDKSEAQKNALTTGKHNHPTKGKKRSDDTKRKIGKSVLESWENLSESELKDRKLKAKENWEKLTDDEKKYIQQKATEAVRVSSKQGSKLENFLVNELIKDGYKIQFHQEQTLANTKLQIDILIPNMNVAIEVDGPSHFAPVWGSDALKRNIKYDQKKTGLILGKGLVLIRIKQSMDFSKSRSLLIYNKLKELLNNISNKFPPIDNRNFLIEDKDNG